MKVEGALKKFAFFLGGGGGGGGGLHPSYIFAMSRENVTIGS